MNYINLLPNELQSILLYKIPVLNIELYQLLIVLVVILLINCYNNNFILNKINNVIKGGEKKNIKVYLFWAEWCGHSNNFMPTWNKLKETKMDSINVEFIDIKDDNEEFEDYTNKFEITGFPTLVILNKNDYEIYNGERTVESITEFINKFTENEEEVEESDEKEKNEEQENNEQENEEEENEEQENEEQEEAQENFSKFITIG